MFDLLFKIVFLLIFLIIESCVCIELFYVLQSNSYDCKSLYKRLFDVSSIDIINLFLYIIIVVFFVITQIDNIYILIASLIVSSVLTYILNDQFKSLKKIKYTKRMLRLIFVLLILMILESVILLDLCELNFAVIFVPLFVIVGYFNVLIVYLILVPVEALIGSFYLRKSKKKLQIHKKLIKIGITGSFGKTSTKEILTTLLNQEFNVLSTPKSYNTPFGISKTINDKLNNSHEVFVCEMGAKKRGEIKYLSELINVDWGIVTSVGRQHTSTFGSLENIYKTKKELPDALYKKLCVFNLMNKYTVQMYKEFVGEKIGVFLCKKHNIVINSTNIKKSYKNIKAKMHNNSFRLYEFSRKNNYYAKSININENGCVFDVYYDNSFLLNAKVILLGYHNIINVLLAVAVAHRFGVKLANIKTGILKLKQIQARLEKYSLSNGAVVINNGYNSNIDSVKHTLETLSLFKRKYKVVITPGVVETNDDNYYNETLGELCAKYCTDVVVVKKKNRDAITRGLAKAQFDMCRVYKVDSFNDAKKIINNSNDEYVFLIENDLPDIYK